jgi:hypothetical protein
MPVNEAAERIRKWAVCLIALSDREIKEHACTVARAWLEEHDPTPIDKAWLLSIGFKPDLRELSLLFIHDKDAATEIVRNGHEDWRVGTGSARHMASIRIVVPPKTRGDVLRLMAALGIPGKEDGK